LDKCGPVLNWRTTTLYERMHAADGRREAKQVGQIAQQ